MPHVESTPQIVKWVVATLIFVVIVSVVVDVIFALMKIPAPAYLLDTGKIAFGSLATILVQTSARNHSEDSPTGTPDDPVATEEVGD